MSCGSKLRSTIGIFAPGQMDVFLCVLAFSVDGILAWLVLHHLDAFALLRLLQTVARYHIKLSDFVLENDERK